ncbi:TNT domain-containing protein [Streptomyces sp. NPDC020801]|uniref:TNT domain-containing protein n=1 Tax=unclassified Streptomyces TaxID=2593676 RepID=UPI00379CC596
MRPSRRCAGFAAGVGLAGSLVMGLSAPSAATAAEDGGRAGALGQVRPGVPAPRPVGLLAQPGPQQGDGPDEPGRPPVCSGLVPYPIAEAYRSYYFCRDWRLGPRRLPVRGVLGNILEGYDRLGGLTAVRFLDEWWDPTLDSGQGDWNYPKDDGFAHDAQGGVIAAPLTLLAGQNLTVDRFGNETGRFLSPAGTKFGRRAIPPSNLNTSDPRYPYSYHLYRVAKDVTVCAGPAAPAFEQPGGAVQYATSSKVCPTIPFTTVANLVSNGTLVRLKVPADRQATSVGAKAASR